MTEKLLGTKILELGQCCCWSRYSAKESWISTSRKSATKGKQEVQGLRLCSALWIGILHWGIGAGKCWGILVEESTLRCSYLDHVGPRLWWARSDRIRHPRAQRLFPKWALFLPRRASRLLGLSWSRSCSRGGPSCHPRRAKQSGSPARPRSQSPHPEQHLWCPLWFSRGSAMIHLGSIGLTDSSIAKKNRWNLCSCHFVFSSISLIALLCTSYNTTDLASILQNH